MEAMPLVGFIASLAYREHPECIVIDSIRDKGGSG
jgi:hypothetical protein